MKKIIFFVLVVFTLGACKNESKEVKAAEEKTVEMIPEEKIETTTAPEFSSKEAQEYVDAYDAFLSEYKVAIENKDQVKLQELANRMVTLSTKGNEALKNLSGDDLTKLTQYMTAKAEEFKLILAQSK